MDKDIAKRMLRDAGMPVARSVTLTTADRGRGHVRGSRGEAGGAVFCEAGQFRLLGRRQQGARRRPAGPPRAPSALRYDHKLLVEEFIRGREIEVAVLGNDDPQASVPGEIVPAARVLFLRGEIPR